MSKRRICIIAFKPVRKTIHALRLIHYLSPHYELTVLGYGDPDPQWPALTWKPLPADTPTLGSKIAKLLRFVPGRVFPKYYDAWFWSVPRHRLAYEYAVASGADAFHANNWQGLLVAIRAARRCGARVVFDMREYGEEEGTNGVLWQTLLKPAVGHFIRSCVADPAAAIDGAVTVCDPIAERYGRELGIRPIVVLNAPLPVDVPPRGRGPAAGAIRLIHHGYAKRGRGLHKLIEALARSDPRFTLDFMLVPDDHGYIAELRRLAERLAPGRVSFQDPVPPAEIVRRVAEYDMGLCVIEPSSYNNLVMLPNKLFEYIQAGLAVCVGPSPAMADLVRAHRVGVVAPSFAPVDVAATLSRLAQRDIEEFQRAARRAAATLNADVEMDKVVALYRAIFGGAAAAPREAARAGDLRRPLEQAPR